MLILDMNETLVLSTPSVPDSIATNLSGRLVFLSKPANFRFRVFIDGLRLEFKEYLFIHRKVDL